MPATLTDVASFDTTIKQADLGVVHFAAEWVEQCGQVDDLFDTLAKHQDYAKVKFYKCDAEHLSEVSLKNKIEAVPTVVIFRRGTPIDRVDGVNAAKITDQIKKHLALAGSGNTDEDAKPKQPIQERLKALVNKAPVMLFMKGDRVQPRCGFSRQTIEILNETGVKYETFDILSDEEVRQGLKTYSDWPTYPQLYVKGDLVGGLDIIKEIKASGELESTLTP